MRKLEVIDKNAYVGITQAEVVSLCEQMEQCNRMLEDGSGAGNDFLGWVNLPSSLDADFLADIQRTADSLASKSEVVVVIGIGGSYLGAKAVLDALSDNFGALRRKSSRPHVVFAGQNLSEDYMHELMDLLQGYEFSTVVISKSGTTTEPAIAFRIIRDALEKRYGVVEAAGRIVAITDRHSGALRKLSDEQGYKSYVIEDNVGGRYSVLTPVGLLPMAVAGINIQEFVLGACDMRKRCSVDGAGAGQNPAILYAALRTALYRSGKKIEILASYEPKLQNIGEWWKQLYGESEGKGGLGIFPASVTLTADLHSMGQYIQDGERTLFETVVSVGAPKYKFEVSADERNLDGLNFLCGKRLSEINRMAQLGTMLAHVDGGVANVEISIGAIDAYHIGALLYMFERACGISGYALGVNPFDQPGVEAYKRNMFALLGKPGFEEAGAALRKRL